MRELWLDENEQSSVSERGCPPSNASPASGAIIYLQEAGETKEKGALEDTKRIGPMLARGKVNLAPMTNMEAMPQSPLTTFDPMLRRPQNRQRLELFEGGIPPKLQENHVPQNHPTVGSQPQALLFDDATTRRSSTANRQKTKGRSKER